MAGAAVVVEDGIVFVVVFVVVVVLRKLTAVTRSVHGDVSCKLVLLLQLRLWL